MPAPQRNTTDAADIRCLIAELKAELHARQQQQRPLPSSVYRAYQAKLDKYYGLLGSHEDL